MRIEGLFAAVEENDYDNDTEIFKMTCHENAAEIFLGIPYGVFWVIATGIEFLASICVLSV